MLIFYNYLILVFVSSVLPLVAFGGIVSLWNICSLIGRQSLSLFGSVRKDLGTCAWDEMTQYYSCTWIDRMS